MESLEQFFNDNDRGYPRDPRRMAYAKLRKNTQGMDREQLEAFIKANLMIPHSQYKMALGNLIQFLQKQDKMNQLNEVRRFQKIAGLINENWHPDDPAGVDIDDIEDKDFDDISETEGDDTDYDESSDSESDDTDAMGGINEDGGEGLDLKSRLEIAQKVQSEVDSYLNSLGYKKISDQEWPKFEKGHGYTRSTPTNAYGDTLKTWPNHWNDSNDEENFDNQNYEGRNVVYNLRVFKPSEDFDFKKLSSIIRSGEKEATSKGAAAFKSLTRSNQDIIAKFDISNWRRK